MQKLPLGKLVKIKTGKLDANAKVDGGQYPFFTCSKEISRIDKYTYDCECVLVAGNGDLNVKYYNGKFDAYQRTYIIEDNKTHDLDMKYLYYFMQSYIDKLRSQTIGGVIQYIKLNNLTDIEIPLPPLPTQKQIIQKLDTLTNLINLRKLSIQKTEKLTKSIFIEMFGDPMINEKGWEVNKLEEYTNLVSSGSTPLGGQNTYLKEGIFKFIRSQNVRMFNLDYEDIFFISDKIHNSMKRTWVKNNDVLLNITGASIGRLAIYKGEDDKANVNQHVCIIRLKNTLNSNYLMYYLGFDIIQENILSQQSGATRQAFNFEQIKNFEIKVPPISLQNKFASIVEKNEENIKKQKESLKKLEELYASVMQESFSP